MCIRKRPMKLKVMYLEDLSPIGCSINDKIYRFMTCWKYLQRDRYWSAIISSPCFPRPESENIVAATQID